MVAQRGQNRQRLLHGAFIMTPELAYRYNPRYIWGSVTFDLDNMAAHGPLTRERMAAAIRSELAEFEKALLKDWERRQIAPDEVP